jgi:hypothetical protein
MFAPVLFSNSVGQLKRQRRRAALTSSRNGSIPARSIENTSEYSSRDRVENADSGNHKPIRRRFDGISHI